MTALLWLQALPTWAKRAIMGASIIAGALALFAVWLHFHNQKIIAEHEADISAQVREKAADASQYADDQDAQRRAGMGQAQSDTRKAMNDAEAKNPEGAKAGVGPVSSAATSELRKRAAKTGSPSGK